MIALDHASRGFRVFPITAGYKFPPLVRWTVRATTDPATVRQWWERWPDANVGIATGSGLVVIDLDGGSIDLPETLTARTPNGLHLYFRCDYTVPNRRNWRPGIDVRGDGGYVLAPGSVVDGQRYEWLIDREPAPLPELGLAGTVRKSGSRVHRPAQQFAVYVDPFA